MHDRYTTFSHNPDTFTHIVGKFLKRLVKALSPPAKALTDDNSALRYVALHSHVEG